MSRAADRFLRRQRQLEAEIVGAEAPLHPFEAEFRRRGLLRGWRVHRPSWPDFLCEDECGLFFVEVKAKGDGLRANQHRTAHLLTRLGFRVYVWSEHRPDRLLLWKPGISLRARPKRRWIRLKRATSRSPGPAPGRPAPLTHSGDCNPSEDSVAGMPEAPKPTGP